MEDYRKGEHPGQYIRRKVLPKKMSVTEAAELLGVSRPTLSNLLNGKASLSPEMALRLEKAFGAKKERLLQIQAAYDNSKLQTNKPSVAVRAYVPSFLEITARQISAWADQIAARSLLPVFLRRLVVTTTENLEKADFPGYDNAQRPGWDGQVQTGTPTPWVPAGSSGWEFGCDQNSRRKAEDDYQARTKSVPKTERENTTLVFVTPRNWPGKAAWLKEKLAEGQWKDIRALDASDLEQWLEQSVPTQSWMSEKLGIDRTDILSLDEAWDQWAKVTKPQLSKVLFKGAVELHGPKLTKWLQETPETPFVITADSKGEALAFLACALEAVSTPQNGAYEQAVVLKSSEALRKISVIPVNFLAIVASDEVEGVLAGMHKTRHTIILRHRGVGEDDPEVSLDLVDDKTFEQGLLEMGIPHEDVPAYARESGQSITVLRRRLAQIPAIKSPEWAQDNKLSRSLIPLWMVGAWDSQKKADQEVVSFLTGRDYPDIDQSITELVALPDSPLWAAGRHRGVVSKIDVLFATHPLITRQEFDRFLSRSQVVLAEKDPALELPEDKRWMAAIYEKTRNHSPALRRSMCDSLVLLSVYGGRLLDKRLAVDVEHEVSSIVRSLLTPLTAETLASQQVDLPYYAEAAPDTFLDILEEDLRRNDPAIMSLMVPADSGIFGGGCPRTGLLWALELLAWKPERLPRVASILARLSERKIDDNWVNKPENSLGAIFRAEMPQTAAPIEERSAALEMIARKFPNVGWWLCMEEFARGGRFGMYSYRPRWRKDAVGAGQPMTHWGLVRPFKEKALQIATTWPSHNAKTLGDLVERLQLIPEDYQRIVWRLIKDWAATSPSEGEKASLKESIRRFAFTRHGRNRKLTDETKRRAQEAQALLEPADLVARYTWLFEKQWVEESFDELEDTKFDYHRHEAKVSGQRRTALEEIWHNLGYEGVIRLSGIGEAATTVGWVLAGILNNEDATEFVYRVSSEPSERKMQTLLYRFLHSRAFNHRDTLLDTLVERFSREGEAGEEKLMRLLSAAPFDSSTWTQLSKLPEGLRARYWREVQPQWNRQSPEDLREAVDRLIEVGRPRAAFFTVHFELAKLDSAQLMQLLRTVAVSAEPTGHYQFDAHSVEEAFRVLDGRADLNASELVPLEFAYLELLGQSERGIPHLEKQLAESPVLFAQALALVFKRKDGGIDPPEWKLDEAREKQVGTHAYRMLHDMRRIPGTRDDGTIDETVLKDWIVQVRALCQTNAREEVGDITIGELLSKSSEGTDGIWPREEVRGVLEEVGTTNIARGMSTGRRNARGAHWRDAGGKQERDLAAQYRGWARKLSFDWPFASRLLEDIAKSYDHDAKWYDADESVNKRLKD